MEGSDRAVVASGLGKRYGRTWGLRDCSFEVPRGRVAALVGPNGAGKSTLLRMAAGITRPTTGDVAVLGRSPQRHAVEVLRHIGYLDQERPLYRGFRVREILKLGQKLNPGWDDALATGYLSQLGISLSARVGTLSVGQQAQVSLTLCLAKCPEVLILDEPVAALDPLAREELMQVLMGQVAERGSTVLVASHVLSDLEAVCDFIVILSSSRVLVADDLDRLLATHRLLIGSRRAPSAVPDGSVVVGSSSTARQNELLVRVEGRVTDPAWDVAEPTLQEIVLAYLSRDRSAVGEAGARRADPAGSGSVEQGVGGS